MPPKSKYPCYSGVYVKDSVIGVTNDDIIAYPYRRQLHCHDVVCILYIEKEHIVMRTIDRVLKPKAGDFIFLLPGTAHALLADNPEVRKP